MSTFRSSLLAVAGVDERLLEELGLTSERERYAALGLFMLIPASIDAVLAGAATTQFSNGWPAPVGTGLAVFLLVLGLERAMVLSARREPIEPTSSSALRRAWRAVAAGGRGVALGVGRLFVAGLLGAVVAHAAALVVFGGDISGMLATERREAVEVATGGAQARLGASEARLAELRTAIADLRNQRRIVERQRADEIGGRGVERGGTAITNVPGGGKVWRELDRRVAAIEADIRDAEKEVSAVEARMAVQVVDREHAAQDVRSTTSRGFLARVAALERLATENPAVRVAVLLFFVMLVVIDLLPLLLAWRITVGSAYALQVTLREWRVEESARIDFEALALSHAHRVEHRAFALQMEDFGLGEASPAPQSPGVPAGSAGFARERVWRRAPVG